MTLQESAEKFAEWAWSDGGEYRDWCRETFLSHVREQYDPPEGARSGAAIGMIVERMAEDGWAIELLRSDSSEMPASWCAVWREMSPPYSMRRRPWADAPTPLLAVLRAATAALAEVTE